MLTGALTLANSYDSGELLGTDDSTLPLRDYRATWVLMVISGAFCIFGKIRYGTLFSAVTYSYTFLCCYTHRFPGVRAGAA